MQANQFNLDKLKLNRCPKCGKYLDFTSDPEMLLCTIKCRFMISHKEMASICMDKALQQIVYERTGISTESQ